MATSSVPKTPKSATFQALSKLHLSKLASKVRVLLRIRPLLASEIAAKDKIPIPCISVLNPDRDSSQEVTVLIKDQETSRNECYKLDSFFGEGENVGLIFQKEVSPVIPGIFHGCNATIFAYGATGSGKTYTMQGTDEHPGLMPLAMSTILSMCKNMGGLVEISYYEVYMDRCYDLLEPKAKEISVLEDKDGRVQLKGLSKVPVHSMSEFHEIFSSGIQRRKVAHTGLNDVSSRSHGVLMIVVSSCNDGSKSVVTGKLNLIDLAGNEDNRRTCNEGIRLQESAKINQSLFALSNVIYALNNNEPRVPYRESKLTRILQDSLGGTSRALMIACLNPVSYQEAVHTVSLAARSRQIVNFVSSAQKQDTPKMKVDMEEKLRAWLESKGKTKSIQRIRTPCSPFLGRTPTPINSLKKPNSCQSSAKTTAYHGVSNAKARKLFDSEALITNAVEESFSSNALVSEDSGISNKEESFDQIEESKDCSHATAHDDVLTIPKDESCEDHMSTLYFVDQLKRDDTAFLHKTENENDKDTRGKPSTCLPDECLDKENMITLSSNFRVSPPISERIRALQNSLRKVLSPIHSNTNTTPCKDLSSNDRICLVLLDPRTPQTPYIVNCDHDENFEVNDTPLDKFNARSSSLKSSLIEEYLAFLNTARREELLALKGIGQKRADYIIHLRETTPQPLKSLSDLENIGLSSKQVHHMFRSAAKEIFTDMS
ncbi:hypothetical protein MRB53_011028 [Persea americana]|uniref:Uncharacterized protein n=1 Tax=Persea americana TaxID=3435 RepID=A0ACC2LTD1_PERAE|nr:hypothetical protein MRB53_011028 [Persea americana]